MKLCTDVHGPQRINPENVGDLMTFSSSDTGRLTYEIT